MIRASRRFPKRSRVLDRWVIRVELVHSAGVCILELCSVVRFSVVVIDLALESRLVCVCIHFNLFLALRRADTRLSDREYKP